MQLVEVGSGVGLGRVGCYVLMSFRLPCGRVSALPMLMCVLAQCVVSCCYLGWLLGVRRMVISAVRLLLTLRNSVCFGVLGLMH